MQQTRFLVTDHPMHDPALGKEAGIMCTYTGYVCRHVWASKRDELLMDGRGKAVMPNGDVYEGDCRLGMFEGLGVMRYHNGDLYDGQWESHLRHGYGVLEYADGRSYSGLFKAGEKSGTGTDTGLHDTYSGTYKDGTANGAGQLINHRTGERINGMFKDGRMHGMCTITYSSGDCYIGGFVDGLPHGEGKFVLHDSGDEYLEEFDKGRCIRGVLGEEENAVVASSSAATSCLDQPLYQQQEIISPIARNRPPTCHARYKASGDEYVGEWLRNSYNDGNRRGKRHGHGTLKIKATGAVYVGSFADDLMEGEGIMTFSPIVEGQADRMLVYRGAFHKNLFHGKATVEYADGTIKEQFFSKGVPHGISHEQARPEVRAHEHQMQSLMYSPADAEGKPVDYHMRPENISD